MKKKMWAIFRDGKLDQSKDDCVPYICSVKNKIKKTFYPIDANDKIKPVTVTDKDPYENVRKLIDSPDDYSLESMNNAALKDKENWDKGDK